MKRLTRWTPANHSFQNTSLHAAGLEHVLFIPWALAVHPGVSCCLLALVQIDRSVASLSSAAMLCTCGSHHFQSVSIRLPTKLPARPRPNVHLFPFRFRPNFRFGFGQTLPLFPLIFRPDGLTVTFAVFGRGRRGWTSMRTRRGRTSMRTRRGWTSMRRR